MSKTQNWNESDYIYIVKALALISIVTAHVGIVSTALPINFVVTEILNSLGSIGVGVFFFISGYLYKKSKKPVARFFLSKITSILIPWLFCGTLLFFYVTLRKGNLNLYTWISTIFIHSHLYYLTVLMIFYLFLWKLKNHVPLLTIIMILSVISIYLTGLDLIKVYPYSNPFNWAVYFIIGMLVKKYDYFEKLVLLCRKWLSFLLSLYILIMVIYIINGSYIRYWSTASFIVEILAALWVFGLSFYIMKLKSNQIFIMVGKQSFSIFLVHTPVAALITNIFTHYNLWYLAFLMPFTVIFVTMFAIEMIRRISSILRVESLIDILLGIRKARIV